MVILARIPLVLSVSKHASRLGLPFVLVACSQSERAPDPNQPAAGDEHIACAVGGQAEFRPVCALERTLKDGKRIFVVRHPDGGFRRFAAADDGTGLATVDGAEEAEVVLSGDILDVTVGADRYRFPGRIAQDAARR